MRRATWRTVLAHRGRLLLTALAITVGSAFVAGSFVFTDTLQQVFDQLTRSDPADVQVTPRGALQIAIGGEAGIVPVMPATVRAKVAAVPGVADVLGGVQVRGVRVMGSDGQPVGVQGPTGVAVSWSSDPILSTTVLLNGRAPQRAGEVAVDETTARLGGLSVGSSTALLTTSGRTPATVVGVFRRGVSGTVATLVALDPASAQKLLPSPASLTQITIKVAPGQTQQQVADRVQAALGQSFSVVTGQRLADDTAARVRERFQFLTGVLLGFAAISVFVATFLVVNTFSMLVAQRTRELALLRAVGASRRQVIGSVLSEAAAVGIAAGALGVLGGLGVAVAIRAVFDSGGVAFPQGALVIYPRTLVVTFAVALTVTLFAAVGPAIRASRIPPVAALRDEQALPARSLRVRAIAGPAMVVLGLVVFSLRGHVQPGEEALRVAGLAALLIVTGVGVSNPVLVRPAVGLLSRLVPSSPVTRMSAENARRNQRRTGATMSSLMIGLVLVSAAATLAASINASLSNLIDRVVKADLVVADKGFDPFGSAVSAALAKVPGVDVVSRVGLLPVSVRADRTILQGVDPATFLSVAVITTTAGDIGQLSQLNSVAVDSTTATEKKIHVGDTLPTTFLSGPGNLTVIALFEPAAQFRGYISGRATLLAHGGTNQDIAVYVRLKPGVAAGPVQALAEKAVAQFPTITVQNQAQFKDQLRGFVDQVLGLIYALLALSVLVAVIGIVNTLALSVVERTREIGLLRAVGLTRRQTRSMVRREAVLISGLGGVLGLGLGVLIGAALQNTLADQGITDLAIPWQQLLVFLVASGLIGVLAAVLPARRAARLDVLAAIAVQ